MNSEKLLRAIGEIDERYVCEALEPLGVGEKNEASVSSPISFEEVTMNIKKVRKISKTGLIAAVVAAALAVTALAAGLFYTRVEPTDGLSGSWSGQSVTFPDAQTYVVFESGAPRRQYQFKANWLPSQPTVGSQGVFANYVADEGEGSTLPYEINTCNFYALGQTRYCFNGDTKILLQDTWNGYERTEVHVDYDAKAPAIEQANYLLLFQPEENYLIYIAGTDDMATLERIAGNLEIRLGDVLTESPEPATDIAWFDLARG